MTESRARRDLDFDYVLDDPDDNNGWYGRAQAGDATVMHEVDELEHDDPRATWQDDPDTDRWYVPPQEAEVVSAPEPAADDVDDPRQDEQYDTNDVYDKVWDEPRDDRFNRLYAPRNGRNGTPQIGEWTFAVSRPEPWYHNKRLRTGLIVAAAVAIAVPLVVLAVRSLATGAEETAPVPSKAPTSAQPAPPSTAPAASTQRPVPPAPPPPPPPPPPPAEQEVPRQYYPQPRQSSPDQSDKPEIGVTRTPVTRAPISATPPPPPKPDRNSSTPGDAPGGGGWGW